MLAKNATAVEVKRIMNRLGLGKRVLKLVVKDKLKVVVWRSGSELMKVESTPFYLSIFQASTHKYFLHSWTRRR